MAKSHTKDKQFVLSPTHQELIVDSSGISLPLEAQKLGEQLLGIARNYMLARRRRGESLLDAARWLSEARAVADEGRWYLFLDVTSTSPDVAERLLNIHLIAHRDSRFAEAIISGHLNQTVAGLLARPSTPTQVVDSLLETSIPPRVSDVHRAIRATHYGLEIEDQANSEPSETIVENPHNAGSITSASARALQNLPPWVTPTCEQLARARTSLLSIHGEIAKLNEYGAAMLAGEIDNLLTAIGRITKTLQER